ncbi:MAG: exo-alpha-sialidase [Gammaproteobacteria bacterium]
MYSYHKKTLFSLIVSLTGLFLINGCQTGAKDLHGSKLAEQAINATVTAKFAPDGRLWRLIPTDDAIFIDSSTDFGKTYSKPVRINSIAQRINIWPENPAIIEINQAGRIHVLYNADDRQKATSFFSYSDDNGTTFSAPAKISDHADTAMNYMDKMLTDKNGKLYMFWHDQRHSQHGHKLGSGVLDLYYTVTDDPASGQFVNQFISNSVCSCCRTAAALSPEGKPVLLARMVFPGGIRDHALIKMDNSGTWQPAQRITEDGWKIDACPEHGPALSIDHHGRAHLTWFTLGDNRQGIFYAHTDDYGKTLSTPIALGNQDRLPGHPDVIAVDKQVIIAWQEFDGDQSEIYAVVSSDRGAHWGSPQKLASSQGKTSYPKLINHDKRVFLSWSDTQSGHRLIEIMP